MGSTVPGSSNNNKEQRRAAALVSDCSPSRFSWSFAVHPRGCIFSGAPVLRTIWIPEELFLFCRLQQFAILITCNSVRPETKRNRKNGPSKGKQNRKCGTHGEQNIVYVYALSFVLGKWASPKKERGKIYVVQHCILDL